MEYDITDAGLPHLKQLTRLQRLSLMGTKATDVGVQELRKALPKAVILDRDGRSRMVTSVPIAAVWGPGSARPEVLLRLYTRPLVRRESAKGEL